MPKEIARKKVVTIGGGTGSFTVLSGLRDYPELDVTAIVSMADDGGSTGKLRDEYGVLPPGDIRQCLVALSESSEELRKLFNYRFSGGTLHGQNLGNIIISGAEKAGGNFAKGLELIHKVLAVRGQVVPVCLSDVRLVTTLGNGDIIKGEHEMDISTILSKFGVQSVAFDCPVSANPKAIESIMSADLIVVCPGDIYISIIPNFLPKGMRAALKKSKAKKVLVCNLMNKFGQTDGLTMADHIRALEKYAGKGFFEYVIFNSKQPAPELLKRYTKEGEPVELEGRILKPEDRIKYKVIKADVIADKLAKPRREYKRSDLLHRTLIRHDPKKLAKVITSLI